MKTLRTLAFLALIFSVFPAWSATIYTGEPVQPPLGWKHLCKELPSLCSTELQEFEPADGTHEKWQEFQHFVQILQPKICRGQNKYATRTDKIVLTCFNSFEASLLLRRALIGEGWSPASFTLAIASDSVREYVVLTIRTSQGTWVYDTALGAFELERYQNRILKQQSFIEPHLWERVLD